MATPCFVCNVEVSAVGKLSHERPTDMISTPARDVAVLMSSVGVMRGGLETLAANCARGLVERGHRVTVVAGHWPGRELPSDLAALPVRWLRVPCVPATLAVWRRVARRRPGWPLKVQSLSFVYACRSHPRVRRLISSCDVTLTLLEIETVAFSIWREQHGRPNVSYFPGVIDWDWLRRDRSVVRVAISRTVAERCKNLPGGFHIDGVVVPAIPGNWLEIPYEVRSRTRTLVFVGRLEANKGVMELLRIFEALAPAFTDLQLRILGDGPLRAVLKTELARAGLSDRVALLGAVPQEQVCQELRDADLFVFPSHYESFGIAILEAQAVGVPVVCSDIPAVREATGDAAQLIPPGDVELWIETIRSLMLDHASRKRMSLAGRQHAKYFTWRQVAAELEQYVDLAISRRS